MGSDAPVSGYEGIIPPSGPQGRFLPLRILTRDLQSGIYSSGGALVTDSIDDHVFAPLRPLSVTLTLGAILKAKQVPPVSFPVIGNDATATFVSETGTAPESDLSVLLALMNPHRVMFSVNYSKLLGVQSRVEFSAMLAQLSLAKFMQAIDAMALTGSGANGQPLGILNTKGTGSLTFGGSATWQKALSFEQSLANANAAPADAALGFALSPDTRAKWKAAQRATGTSTFLMDDFDRVAGDQALATTELNSTNAGDRVIYGDWKKLYICLFLNGLFLIENPFANAKTGETTATFSMFCDVGLVQPQAMVVSTDSGAQ
jgi:HK97 family phage major capsid protein